MTSSMTPCPASAPPLVFAEADEKVVVVIIQRCIRRWLSRQMVKQRKIEDTDHVEDEVIKFVPKTVTKK